MLKLYILIFFTSFQLFGDDLLVNFTENPPKVDGVADDIVWQKIKEKQLKINNNIFLVKICTDRKKIFFLISFEKEEELLKHKYWRWDKDKKVYLSCDKQEQSLTLFFRNSKNASIIDLWIWRAGRTNFSNTADDCYMPLQKPLKIQEDLGVRAWYSKYFSNFSGEEIPRFYNRTPKGSIADVQAKGEWKNGVWNIEFSRKLISANDDDVHLDIIADLEISISSQLKQIHSMEFIKLKANE